VAAPGLWIFGSAQLLGVDSGRRGTKSCCRLCPAKATRSSSCRLMLAGWGLRPCTRKITLDPPDSDSGCRVLTHFPEDHYVAKGS
jgi:hypothetical protein